MLSLPITFLSVIGVFAPIFSRPLWPHVQVLLTGAVLAPGKRTVTAVLQIMGRSAAPDFQTYHRVLNRAVWSPLTASRLLFRLLVAVCIFRGVVILGLDDTMERRRGEQIAAKGIYRDPGRSSHTHMVKASGLRWLACMLLTPLAWADRVWALPFLTVLCPSERFYAQRGRRPQTLTERAWQMIRLVGRWVPGRAIVWVADSSFAALELLATVQTVPCASVITRLRLDAALYDPLPPRPPGTRGRPRRKGTRRPTLEAVVADKKTQWTTVTVEQWYGEGPREVEVPTVPSGLHFELTNSYAMVQASRTNTMFLLSTQFEDYGTVIFQAQKSSQTEGKWGFAFGLNLGSGALSAINGLDVLEPLVSLFELQELVLVLSSFDSTSFSFPGLEHFNQPAIASKGVSLPAQSNGIIAGLNVYAQWNFDNSQQQQFLKKFLGIDDASLGITLQIGENPGRNAKLFASITAQVEGLCLSAQFGGLIRNGEPGFFLMGEPVAPIQGTEYTFTVTLLFVANGAFLSGTMMGATSIDLELFKLSNVTLAVGINWEGIPSLGIAGTIDVETYQSSLAVFFNANNPSQSLVAGSVSDLTLKDILDTLTGDTIPSEIDEASRMRQKCCRMSTR